MKKMLNTIGSLLLLPTLLFAASGHITSAGVYEGEFTADVGVATVTQISQLEDVLLTYSPHDGSEVPSGAYIDACIYTNAPAQQYKITLTSDQGAAKVVISTGKKMVPEKFLNISSVFIHLGNMAISM